MGVGTERVYLPGRPVYPDEVGEILGNSSEKGVGWHLEMFADMQKCRTCGWGEERGEEDMEGGREEEGEDDEEDMREEEAAGTRGKGGIRRWMHKREKETKAGKTRANQG